MRTAVISDLHIGSRLRIDLLRRRDVLDKLLDGLTGVDRLVLLGDTLELRDRPLRAVLELARPFFAAIGDVCRDGEVWLVPGNHDHRIAREVLGRQTGRAGLHGLSHAQCFAPPDRTIAARIASDLGCPVVIGYPGVYLARGVYATHGHYADAHSSALSLETGLAALAVAARPGMRHDGPASAADYEAVLAPTYALYDGIAQRRRLQAAADAGKRLVRAVETRAGSRGAVDADGASAPVPRPESSARSRRRFGTVSGERRRPGVLPLARVLERLEVDAHTVLFGHTHRIGPVDGDPAAWTTAGGVALHNTGSWVLEPAMGITGRGPPGDRPTTLDPYWPGVVTFVDKAGLRASRLLAPTDLMSVL